MHSQHWAEEAQPWLWEVLQIFSTLWFICFSVCSVISAIGLVLVLTLHPYRSCMCVPRARQSGKKVPAGLSFYPFLTRCSSACYTESSFLLKDANIHRE